MKKFYLNVLLEGGKVPERAHNTDAGFDVFAPHDVFIPAGCSTVFSLGFRCEFPSGYCLKMVNKSGRASKDRLFVGATIIDHGYTGLVKLNLFNFGEDITIYSGEKAAQFIVLPIWQGDINEVSSIDFNTTRGDGGFGSTGK